MALLIDRFSGTRAPVARVALALALGMTATPASAQMTEIEFDEARAYVSEETIFVPFRVSDADVRPLREALDDGAVQRDTWLVVMEHDAGRLAMVMDQMAYHHVAQGELMGEPWMVSF